MVPKTISKNLTLDNCLSTGKPVYVKNTTRNPGGQINLTITDPLNGKSHPLRIYKTWIPFCLNDLLSTKMIEGSHDLRQAIYKGALTLIDADEAEKILSQPDAIEERNRLNHISRTSRRLMPKIIKTPDLPSDGMNMPLSEENVPKQENLIHGKVLDIVNSVLERTITTRDAVSEVHSCEDELKIGDYQYMVAELDDGQLKDYAQRKFSQLRNK